MDWVIRAWVSQAFWFSAQSASFPVASVRGHLQVGFLCGLGFAVLGVA